MSSIPIIGNIVVPILGSLLSTWLGLGSDGKPMSTTGVFLVVVVALGLAVFFYFTIHFTFVHFFIRSKLNPARQASQPEYVYSNRVRWQAKLTGGSVALFFFLCMLFGILTAGVK